MQVKIGDDVKIPEGWEAVGHANRETTINSYLDPRHEADRSCDLLPDLEG